MSDVDPSVQEWLTRFARALGMEPPADDDVDAVLELAAVAAHASQRQAAPIACWLAGRAGIPLDEALRTAESLTT